MNTNTNLTISLTDYWPKADFCFRCVGDCMENAGISDGDIVFIKAQETVTNGEIAAVAIDGRAYLKQFYATDNEITLISKNPRYTPIVFEGNERRRVTVIGKALGILHSLEMNEGL